MLVVSNLEIEGKEEDAPKEQKEEDADVVTAHVRHEARMYTVRNYKITPLQAKTLQQQERFPLGKIPGHQSPWYRFKLSNGARGNPTERCVLCLSPTYELAIQTGEAAAKMAQFCPDIKPKFAVRGEEVTPGTKLTDHIIIGTPGKVLDWGLKYRVIDLKKIRVFVLDEADTTIAQMSDVIFSATYDKEVMEFAEHIVPEANIIRLKREQESLDNIKQYYVRCRSEDEKYQAIQNIYGNCKTAGWLAGKLSSDGHSVAVLSGDLTVEQRLTVLDRFRMGLEKVLITTNVLSRGNLNH
ncbi:DEAD-box helicase Dbp80 [Eumeta japonica]|uniref:RNA helicase n=1 Tax=Eumeta variegata TaxID=151549 RepID=A0A4C2AAW2_EUMVA|nr:DEAD-box helicase Dbp80 [Eumeta japonica]